MSARSLRVFVLLALASLAFAATAQAAPNCVSPARRMQWPSAANPVWDFCFLTPTSSTSQSGNGSGLDIFDVHYNGHLVLERAHAPVLNVLYAPGGACSCFRDWSDSEVRFQSDSFSSSPGGYSEPTQPPLTVCETGGSGGDVGSFRGVAAYKTATDLELTTQFQAGWYRYTMRWVFALDGTITASFGFAALTATCVAYDHTHHNYWRLDFDIDGAGTDTLSQGIPLEGPGDTGGTRPRREFSGNWNGAQDFVAWDYKSRRGYRIVPGVTNVPDTFAVADYWVLRYKSNEIDDAFVSGSNCPIRIQSFVNNETIDGQDVVVWLRGGAFHEGAELDHCGKVGFTLQPVGDWSP
jgi:hypothetical protein